jgi:hypothetical protein
MYINFLKNTYELIITVHNKLIIYKNIKITLSKFIKTYYYFIIFL